ncbi:MAG: MBL fold metallo-hydrolase [Chloracidobacterium sp.]|uniref:MBL fold metallo-hydrolase n=1 Tax=Chloracidobacterium validum TaxID=2821543 RepID=A0ABX8BAB6_9BACT|nr:MBL fold metallo-hydrolase [Chloracidobacterium validum]QUW03879.1 MBL fold metallo-hydrolase [Chloracidobacterium validum]
MRFTILASGSAGNATLIASDRAAVLVDAGLSARALAQRMTDVGFDPARLTAIVITHEHADHVGGLSVLARRLAVPVFIAPATRQQLRFKEKDMAAIRWADPLTAEAPITIGDLTLTPIAVPHDAAEPFVFTAQAGGVKLAVVTDLGYIPAHVAHHLTGCQALVLEANHDRDMLQAGNYPWELKQRIAGRLGHLSNDAMARFLREDFDGQAAHIILAHLSQQNNHPELARLAALQSLGDRYPRHAWTEVVSVAPPHGFAKWHRL